MTTIKVGRCLLQKILDKHRMTQVDLSMKTGLSTTQISEYITGKRGMSLKNAKVIANALHCFIDELYEWIIE
jgi:transcriptional regulator with XRE-family HTH domain